MYLLSKVYLFLQSNNCIQPLHRTDFQVFRPLLEKNIKMMFQSFDKLQVSDIKLNNAFLHATQSDPGIKTLY